MDPASAVGLAGAILGLTSVVGSGVNKLANIKRRYQNTDIAVSAMIGQLYTIKAALDQIASLSSSTTAPSECIPERFLPALDTCRVLTDRINQRIDQIMGCETETSSRKFKIQFIFAEQEMKDYLTHLDRQVNALNLLLLALQWFVILTTLFARVSFFHTTMSVSSDTIAAAPTMSNCAWSTRTTV